MNARIKVQKTCSTLIIDEYTKLPAELYVKIMQNSFVASITGDRQLTCVLPNGNELNEIWKHLTIISDIAKVEMIG
ncbi:MAG TPA: hypothetical protein VJ583_03420 [Nitrososphaeraceae archaeon]|nr:hypothetical protein [Nitrososphaeraceae archaeon]